MGSRIPVDHVSTDVAASVELWIELTGILQEDQLYVIFRAGVSERILPVSTDVLDSFAAFQQRVAEGNRGRRRRRNSIRGRRFWFWFWFDFWLVRSCGVGFYFDLVGVFLKRNSTKPALFVWMRR